ncbi:MAG TPA: alpha/beta hydrolase [Vicinamibacterales bacterium]|nr:alpha/beta hydrolase [Vicinamibacterales bacterium]
MRCRGYACLVAFVMMATLTCFAQTVTTQGPVAAGAMTMVPVQGRMMGVRVARLAERQQGRPVVVLEGGALQSIDTWDPIFDRVAALAPVIAYDRRGIGRSEFDGDPPTLAHVNETLHALLAAINAPPPYVLVGHSYGGVLARAFARQYPTEVAGMVYLDVPDTDLTEADLASVSPDAAGVLRSELDGLPPDLHTGLRAELDNIRRLMANDFTELNAVRPPAGIPVAAVVAAGKLDQVRDPVERSTREAILRIQIRHQQDWALSSPQGLFAVTKRGGHNVHHDNPDLTVAAIRHVLATIAMR